MKAKDYIKNIESEMHFLHNAIYKELNDMQGVDVRDKLNNYNKNVVVKIDSLTDKLKEYKEYMLEQNN